MPINLCCDVCQGFIKHVSTRDAQEMLRRKEPTVCVVCQTTRDRFRKSCEKVLIQLQRESEKMKAGVESQFLNVMKEAIEGSVNQVTIGEENESSPVGEKSGEVGGSIEETDEGQAEETKEREVA